MVFNKLIRRLCVLEAIDIHHHSLPSHYEPPNKLNKITRVLTKIFVKTCTLVEICDGNCLQSQ